MDEVIAAAKKARRESMRKDKELARLRVANMSLQNEVRAWRKEALRMARERNTGANVFSNVVFSKEVLNGLQRR